MDYKQKYLKYDGNENSHHGLDTYKNKYLKYKSKYLTLKNQFGGLDFNELNEKCTEQIKKNNFDDCTYCHYSHITNEHSIVKNANSEIKNLYSIQNPGKSFSACTDHYKLKKYFEVESGFKLEKYNDLSNSFFEIPYTKDNILNTDLFYGLKSYKINCDQDYDIELHPKKIHTLCAEGNIVWVTKDSKVGSTGVDSCMFAVIILNNETKICIHHNIIDSVDYGAFDSETIYDDNVYIKRNGQDVKFSLSEIFSRAKINPSDIKKVYLITRDKQSYDGSDEMGLKDLLKGASKYYDDVIRNIIGEYNSMAPGKVIEIIDSKYKAYDIIVDDNNNILNIKKN